MHLPPLLDVIVFFFLHLSYKTDSIKGSSGCSLPVIHTSAAIPGCNATGQDALISAVGKGGEDVRGKSLMLQSHEVCPLLTILGPFVS